MKRSAAWSGAVAVPAVLLCGCVERRIEITSEPPGALVWVNDQQVGRTPTEMEFLFHGYYDVRVELEGYEPIVTDAEADAPLYEHAPIDLAAEALPFTFRNTQHWHFVLEPSIESTLSREELEAGLLDRAAGMRADLAAIPGPAGDDEDAAEPAEDAGDAPPDGAGTDADGDDDSVD